MLKTEEVVVTAVVVVVVVVVEVLPLDWGSFAEPQSMTLPGISSTSIFNFTFTLHTVSCSSYFSYSHLSFLFNLDKDNVEKKTKTLVPVKPLHSLPRKYHHHELSRRSLRLDYSKSYHQDHTW